MHALVPAATFVVVAVVHVVDVFVFTVVVLMLLSVVAVVRLAAVVLVLAPLSPGYPNPLFGTYMLYLLKHCPPQAKTCFGCGQTLKPGSQIGEPSYDLVIVSNAKRSYYDRAGQLQERPGNVYYHVNAGSMKKHQAYFMASQVQILHVIKDMMTPAPYLFVREFGLEI